MSPKKMVEFGRKRKRMVFGDRFDRNARIILQRMIPFQLRILKM
jgi:hypothetical protein